MPPSPDYLPFHPNPSKPEFTLPTGTWDAHCHVFGPEVEFPFASERKYTPVDAGKDKLFELHKHLGVERSVIVQATCHGADNRALVDALNASNGRYRGIATVRPDVTKEQLDELDAAGVRGVRFNFVKRLVDATPREDFLQIVDLIKPYGWHIVVYFEAADLEGLEQFLIDMPVTVVIDHLGRPDVTKGIDHPDFLRFRKLVKENEHIWVKVTCPERLTVAGPPYEDVVEFGKIIVEEIPDRVIWGTDWPHPNMKSHVPDDGKLVDHILRVAPTKKQQQALLIDNPTRLYDPEN
ncbi:MAG: amidohydrolase family protein [Thalassospira sp.]|uniref:amidohydrolase family protein n=1 Tax=Thalassospira sp. TaxID=1912094 RepID=UPI0032F054C2